MMKADAKGVHSETLIAILGSLPGYACVVSALAYVGKIQRELVGPNRANVKINGVPAALDYRKPRGDGDAEVKVRATLDEAARTKFGLDLGAFVSGPVPVKIEGRVASTAEGECRFAIEADLTQARIDKL